jgi:hypothetical protein
MGVLQLRRFPSDPLGAMALFWGPMDSLLPTAAGGAKHPSWTLEPQTPSRQPAMRHPVANRMSFLQPDTATRNCRRDAPRTAGGRCSCKPPGHDPNLNDNVAHASLFHSPKLTSNRSSIVAAVPHQLQRQNRPISISPSQLFLRQTMWRFPETQLGINLHHSLFAHRVRRHPSQITSIAWHTETVDKIAASLEPF